MAPPANTDLTGIGLTCLHCGTIQVPSNRTAFDNWNCGCCHSGFISVTMLSNLVPRGVVNQSLEKRKPVVKGRGCIMCKKTMELTEVHHNHKNVKLELCRHCHLLWFDSGELLRLLRYREEIIVDSEEELEAKIAEKEARRPHFQAKTEDEAPPPEGIPVLTFWIFGIWMALLPLVHRYPSELSLWFFDPKAPFERHGLPWITSLFLYDNVFSMLVAIVVLLVIGGNVEHRLERGRFFGLFLTAGVIAKFSYLFPDLPVPQSVNGASDAICGVFVYWLFTFPFVRYLYPKDRWRSPAGLLMGWAVAIVCLFIGFLGFNFFEVQFQREAIGIDVTVVKGSLLGTLSVWFASASARAHAFGALVGFLWYTIDASAAAVRPRPKKPAKQKLLSVRNSR